MPSGSSHRETVRHWAVAANGSSQSMSRYVEAELRLSCARSRKACVGGRLRGYGRMERSPVLPRLIQGGMGVGVSGWALAREVAFRGQLGVVSGTALDTIMIRRLGMGDPGGHMRRAMARFPVAGIGRRAQFMLAWRVEARRQYFFSLLRGVNLLMCLLCLAALLIVLPPNSPQLTSAMSMLVALLSIANGAVGTPAPARQSGRQG